MAVQLKKFTKASQNVAVKEIRRNGRLHRYKPRTKIKPGNKTYRRKGRPSKIIPPDRQSPEFRMIQKYFITPLLFEENWPPEMTLSQRLEIILCTSTRDIVPAILVSDVEMPGFVIDPHTMTDFRLPSKLEKRFPRGTPVFVRIDDTMPNSIDIESCEKPNLIFRLTRSQYLDIVNKLKEIDGCDYRLDPPGILRTDES